VGKTCSNEVVSQAGWYSQADTVEEISALFVSVGLTDCAVVTTQPGLVWFNYYYSPTSNTHRYCYYPQPTETYRCDYKSNSHRNMCPCFLPGPPSPSPPPPSPSPPALKPVSNFAVVATAPDHQQPWVSQQSITERNLCTPTAFAAQAGALYAGGALPEVPTGHPYNPGVVYDADYGWMDFAFDGPSISGSNPASWSGVTSAATPNPSFDWWFNTNGNGASDVAGSTPGTQVGSSIAGAEQFYQRTPLANKWGSMSHKVNPQAHGLTPYGATSSAAGDLGGTLNALKASLAAQRPVVLFLDSYGVQSTGATSDSEPATSLYHMGPAVTSVPHLEENYAYNSDTPLSSIGHTVLAVGSYSADGCEWLVVQDNDHTTPQYVALPFDSACGGTRSVWDSLIASFYVDAPQHSPPPPLTPRPPGKPPSPPPPRPEAPPQPPFTPVNGECFGAGQLDHYVQFTLQSTGYPVFNDAALACRQIFDCKAILWAPDFNEYFLRTGTTTEHIPGSGYIAHLKDTSNLQCDPVIKTGFDCANYVNINFDASCNDPDNLVVANLGGYNSALPAELRFKRVAVHEDIHLDFVIKNTSRYTPASSGAQFQGCNGIMGQISFLRNQLTTFTFELRDTVTDALVTLPRFKVSILDIDSTHREWIERARFNGFHSYYVEPDTYLDIVDDTGTSAQFVATKRDTQTSNLGADNPDNPWALTNHQKKKAAMLEYRSTSGATFEFHQGDTSVVAWGGGGGMFMIYGQTNMQASEPLISNPYSHKPLTLALIMRRKFATTRRRLPRRRRCRVHRLPLRPPRLRPLLRPLLRHLHRLRRHRLRHHHPRPHCLRPRRRRPLRPRPRLRPRLRHRHRLRRHRLHRHHLRPHCHRRRLHRPLRLRHRPLRGNWTSPSTSLVTLPTPIPKTPKTLSA
jgi:hypothetical protein